MWFSISVKSTLIVSPNVCVLWWGGVSCPMSGVKHWSTDWLINWFIHFSDFFDIEGDVALDRNPRLGYHTLLLRLIPGVLQSACHHGQFHTLPSPIHNRVALLNSYTNAYVPSREAVIPFLWLSLVWPDQGANSWPTAWGEDTLTKKPSRCGIGQKTTAINRDCRNMTSC